MIRSGRLACLVAGVLASGAAVANDFSFTGTFSRDDDVQSFNFNVGATSNVTLQALSYAGGVNAAGQTIARGGFDTILALFDSSGVLIGQNDDGHITPDGIAGVTGTGEGWDTFLQSTLAPGSYSVSIAQYDNFAIGPNLSDGYSRAGQGNFTSAFSPGACGGVSFCDVSGVPGFSQRDNHWAFDILNVNSAAAVPEPETYAMLLAGLGLLGFVARRRSQNAA